MNPCLGNRKLSNNVLSASME